MSEDITFNVDYSEFSKAINDYVEATGKTLAESLNRCAKNIAIQSLKNTDKADQTKLNNLKQADKFMWWLAWQIQQKVYGKNKEHNQKHFLRTGAYMQNLKRKESYKRAVQAINKRKSATGFLRAFFNEMSKAIDGKGSGKSFTGITPHFHKATSEAQQAELGVKYDYKKQTPKQVTDAERILEKALQSGVNSATKDMREYIFKKLQEAGAKHGTK